jgi:serine/threonine-protein kinase
VLSVRLALPKFLALGVLAVGALSLPPLELPQRLDRAFYDLWSRLAPPAAPDDIVLVALDKPAQQSDLIETARWQHARLMLTTLPDAPVVAAGEVALLGPVAVASARMPILKETGWIEGGYLWPRPDLDGVIRFERPTLGDVEEMWSLAFAAAARAGGPESDSLPVGLEDGSATDRFGRRWLRFYAPDAFAARSPREIRQQPDALTDKIVIAGTVSGPAHATPVGPQSTGQLLAHAIASYRGSTAVATNIWLEVAGWLLAAVCIAATGLSARTGLMGFVIPAGGAAVLFGAGTASFMLAGAWIPVGGPGLLVLGLSALAFRQPAPERPAGNGSGQRRTLVDARRLFALGDFAEAWSIYRALAMSNDLLSETYELGCGLAERGENRLAADVFHRIAQADAGYKDVASRLVASCAIGEEKAAQDLPKPETLGRYEVLGLIGGGAMGVVYLGRDPSINRIVAIKAIYLEREFEASHLEEARERFTREAETAGRLSHPSIVTIYDIGEEQNIAYIAMEYVRGIHLNHHSEPDLLLPVTQVIDLMARVADALDYAHLQNVVHRDIKPANIMYDSNTDLLKITDFGIARLMDVSRTRTGVILGTPSYMSPEQLQGENVNGHTDLFALGVTLYQLLTGHLPFRGTSMTELMFVIANEPHIPVTAVRAELPPVLDTLLDRAMAKDPGDRYASGAEMAQALRAARADCCGQRHSNP